MMPSVDLPNNGNVWQTTEPVKGRPTMYQQVISIIGKLNHRILPAQVTSLSRHLRFLLSNFKVQTVDFYVDSHINQLYLSFVFTSRLNISIWLLLPDPNVFFALNHIYSAK